MGSSSAVSTPGGAAFTPTKSLASRKSNGALPSTGKKTAPVNATSISTSSSYLSPRQHASSKGASEPSTKGGNPSNGIKGGKAQHRTSCKSLTPTNGKGGATSNGIP
ncbi:unnamed protein product, partial [Amoebophrya sp. A25]|eukprot:GSA25T00015932001.1